MEALKCDECGEYETNTSRWYIVDLREDYVMTRGEIWPKHLCSSECGVAFFQRLAESAL